MSGTDTSTTQPQNAPPMDVPMPTWERSGKAIYSLRCSLSPEGTDRRDMVVPIEPNGGGTSPCQTLKYKKAWAAAMRFCNRPATQGMQPIAEIWREDKVEAQHNPHRTMVARIWFDAASGGVQYKEY